MNQHAINNVTEKDGLAIVMGDHPAMVVPTLEEKKLILSKIGCSKKFLKAFDAIMLKVPTIGDIQTTLDFTFIEFKTSAKRLPEFPKGYWTGLTNNERMLATVFGQNYQFCLVNTHPETTKYMFFTIEELDGCIRSKNFIEGIKF